MTETQISAYISLQTKEAVDRFVAARGLKKGHLIEEALLHHLQALRELPADVIIPPRIELSEASFGRLLELLERPGSPTEAMRRLMADEPIEGEP